MGINYFKPDDRGSKFDMFEQLDTDKVLGYEAYQDFTEDDLNMIVE